MSSQSAYLLKKRAFLPLFLAQFFGAFNDNAFKLSMLTLISYHLTSSQGESERYQAVAGALFILPYFLFSATAGQLADKYDKGLLAKLVKFFELLLVIFGGFALYKQNIFLMLTTLTGLGIHSTFFGPIKYAILPNHLPRQELLGANALIEASTFLAILLGTTLGTLSIGSVDPHPIYAVVLIITMATIGFVASLFIPPAFPKCNDLIVDWHFWRATKTMLQSSLVNMRVLPAMLGISWFWLIGAVMLTKLPDYTHYVLRADSSVFAVFLALFSIGIGIGSMSISHFLKGKITLSYVPLAMFMLSIFIVDLYWASSQALPDMELQSLREFFSVLNHIRISIDFFLFSFCSGLFIVPLYAYLQVVSDEGMRARIIAANNIFNALFMVLGTVFVMILLYFNVAITVVFLCFAILNMLAALGLWLLLYKTAHG